MLRLVVAMLLCACAPQGTSPATQVSEQEPAAPAPTPSYSDSYEEAGGVRLARECAAGKPVSCSVLAGAYEDGSTPNAPEIGRDQEKAFRYRVKACDLGSGADCDRVGDALLNGKGVEKDKKAAVKYFVLACNDVNPLTGFACGSVGEILLDLDFLGNYDEAMGFLARGCQSQQVICKMKALYQGTGLVPSSVPPHGAVGYVFGATAKEVGAVCSQQGGKFDANPRRGSPTCHGPQIDALKIKARYVSLEFCKRDSLCAIDIAIDETPSEFYKHYTELKSKLVEVYGTPSQVIVKTTPDCRKVGTAAACIEAGNATFSSTWSWNEKGAVSLGVVASDGSIANVLGYYTGEKAQTLGTNGL